MGQVSRVSDAHLLQFGYTYFRVCPKHRSPNQRQHPVATEILHSIGKFSTRTENGFIFRQPVDRVGKNNPKNNPEAVRT
jgi:hypothetical protein